MTELISGKEALIALANGEEVEFQRESSGKWQNAMTLNLFSFSSTLFEFRLKPRTITINGIEVPAPFEPKIGEEYWCFSTQTRLGYGHNTYKSECEDRRYVSMGAWRTEAEIKQVVAALRKVFGGTA